MPMTSVKLLPGVDTVKTPALNEAGISASNLIRFRNGLVEKLGGWVPFYNFAFSNPPRALWPWADLEGVSHLAVGTASELSVITAGTKQDVTPQTLNTNNATAFATTSGSPYVGVTDSSVATTIYDYVNIITPVAVGGLLLSGFYAVTPTGATTYTIKATSNATSTTITTVVPSFTTTGGQFTVLVTLPNHGYSNGQSVAFNIPTNVGGLTISGFYTVAGSTTNTFTINAPLQATSSATASMNGGQTNVTYWLTRTPGSGDAGFGLLGFGVGGFGTGASQSTRPGAYITATDWTLDNYGEQLIACPINGPIFSWAPQSGFLSATLNGAAPIVNTGILVANAQQMIVAYGSSVLGQQDPLLVRWCDVGNPSVWTASVTNQAGSYRLPTGSRIVGALATPQQILLWTDVDLWSMQYIGYPLVFGFTKIASGCGLVAQKAVAALGNAVFWMSQDQFWAYSGGAGPIACSVYDSVFPEVDKANFWKIRAGANSALNEVKWFFPVIGGSGENSAYASYSTTQQVWDIGQMQRSAWADQSVLGLPMGASPNGFVYQHETSPDASGSALTPSFTTGFFMLQEGEDIPYIDMMRPDIRFDEPGTVNVTIMAAKDAFAPVASYGPYAITPSTQFINLNIRGRMIALQFSSSDLGSVWRLGNTRFRYQANGRR